MFDLLVSVNKIFIFFFFLYKVSMPPNIGSLASSEILGAFGTTTVLPCLCFLIDFYGSQQLFLLITSYFGSLTDCHMAFSTSVRDPAV